MEKFIEKENYVDTTYESGAEYEKMLRMKRIGKKLKSLFEINKEDINGAIKKVRSEWKQ